MRREKRSTPIKTYVRPEIRRQLELFCGNVITLSEYLAEMCEREVLQRRSMDIAKQTIGRRVGNQ